MSPVSTSRRVLKALQECLQHPSSQDDRQRSPQTRAWSLQVLQVRQVGLQRSLQVRQVGLSDRTPLIVPGAPVLLDSFEGVRQGDPFGSFLFSVADRPIVESLQAHLGDDFIIVAYLDDTYVLSRFSDPLDRISEFFSRPESSLQLKLGKCKTLGMDYIERERDGDVGDVCRTGERQASPPYQEG